MAPLLQNPLRKRLQDREPTAEDAAEAQAREREQRQAEQLRFLREQEHRRAGTSVGPPGSGPSRAVSVMPPR